MRREEWNGATFTGQNNVRSWHSEWVCEPCVCVAEWKPGMAMPVPVERNRDEEHEAAKTAAAKAKAQARADKLAKAYEDLRASGTATQKAIDAAKAKADEAREAVETAAGRDRGANWRNYALLFDASETPALHVLSKGFKPEIRAWLRRPHKGPWFAALADTGQKHVLPWTPVNYGPKRGRARFEEREFALPDEQRFALLDDLEALLTAGATKEEVLVGSYSASTYLRCGDAVDAFERQWSTERGSVWWDLAVWLSQRDEAKVAERLEAEKRALVERKKREKEAAKKPQKERASGPRRNASARAGTSADRAVAPDPPRVPDEPASQPAQVGRADAEPSADRSKNRSKRGGTHHEPAQEAPARSADERQRSLF